MIDQNKREITTHENPLVTVALFAYNQERFVREAVESAFAQTYLPLQIILSDDCSTDGTFEIMREMVSAYSGRHRVLLVRNEQNEGIGGHINRVMKLAEGELIVGVAGDDISMPTRVERLVGAWIRGERRAHSVYSAAIIIDEMGKELRTADSPPKDMPPVLAIKTFMDGVQGCTHAWSREVFSVFGAILPDTVYEDRVIPLRSVLLGGIAYCSEPLVKYRIHGANISHYFATPANQILSRTISIHARNLNVVENYLRDLRFAETHPKLSGIPWLSQGIKVAVKMHRRLADKLSFHTGSSGVKFKLICRYIPIDPVQAIKWLIVLLRPNLYVERQKRNLGIR